MATVVNSTQISITEFYSKFHTFSNFGTIYLIVFWKIRFIRFWSRLLSKSSFQENSYWGWAFLKSWFWDQSTSKRHMKTNFRPIGFKFLVKDTRGYWKRGKKSYSWGWVLSEASCIRFTIHGNKFWNVCSSVQQDKWRDFVIFEKTNISQQTRTYFRWTFVIYVLCPLLRNFVIRLMPKFCWLHHTFWLYCFGEWTSQRP